MRPIYLADDIVEARDIWRLADLANDEVAVIRHGYYPFRNASDAASIRQSKADACLPLGIHGKETIRAVDFLILNKPAGGETRRRSQDEPIPHTVSNQSP